MMWPLETIVLLLLLASAVTALQARDLLASVVALGVYSFGSAFLFAVVGAVDVGFTEAVVGAGITGLFFILALHKTRRRSLD
ncbi:MAG: DUF4040 domain-containing protein [Planctomycetes bacterium]|nr:DUF4040 domain-containing protein [Planctomycetota bacterium]MBM4083228.1 DUF4040 domain-containing protein [Planctomycetota bacterium]